MEKFIGLLNELLISEEFEPECRLINEGRFFFAHSTFLFSKDGLFTEHTYELYIRDGHCHLSGPNLSLNGRIVYEEEVHKPYHDGLFLFGEKKRVEQFFSAEKEKLTFLTRKVYDLFSSALSENRLQIVTGTLPIKKFYVFDEEKAYSELIP